MLFVDCLDGVGYLMLALLVWGGGLSCGLILPLADHEGVSLAVYGSERRTLSLVRWLHSLRRP